MSRLLLPPQVEAEILKEKHVAERERRRALANRLLDFDDPVCREWEPVLKQLDPQLRLGRARGQAYEPGMNVRPNFYHWVRDNGPAAPMTIDPITGPDGVSFSEPDSGLLERLKANDLQDPIVYRALIEQHAAAEARRERDREQERQDRVEDVIDRYKSVTTASVSMNTDSPWSQNNQPAARRDRKARKR